MSTSSTTRSTMSAAAKNSKLAPPPPVEPAPEAEPVDPRPHLDEADMHKLFHLGSYVERLSTQIGMLEKDDVNDELNLKLQQETLQRLQAEFAVRRHRRANEKFALNGQQQSALRDFILFRDSLSDKYGLDISGAAIDDRTGLIQFPATESDASDSTSP